MMHKSEDYKISAVKYYLKNKDNIRKTCRLVIIKFPVFYHNILLIFHRTNKIE